MIDKAVWTICILVPVEIRSEANLRQHWRKRYERSKAQKEAVAWFLKGKDKPVNPVSITVTITRIGGRRLDTDNLAGGAKAIRDAVAHWVGIDDGDSRYRFVYEQRKGSNCCTEIHIAWEVACAALLASAP
jgi:hypothetical protein